MFARHNCNLVSERNKYFHTIALRKKMCEQTKVFTCSIFFFMVILVQFFLLYIFAAKCRQCNFVKRRLIVFSTITFTFTLTFTITFTFTFAFTFTFILIFILTFLSVYLYWNLRLKKCGWKKKNIYTYLVYLICVVLNWVMGYPWEPVLSLGGLPTDQVTGITHPTILFSVKKAPPTCTSLFHSGM